MTLETVKDYALVIGGVAGLTTFLAGVAEYARQANLLRGEAFIAMRWRFMEGPFFRELLNLLDGDDPRLADLPAQDRRNFVGFLEEIAPTIFGRDVSLADASERLWRGLHKEDRYWTLFRRYAEEHRALEGTGVPKGLSF